MKNCLLVVFSFSFIFCQAKLKPLKVGDRMPDYTFINLINYPKTTEKFSNFSGKLVILDFWSTGCSSCVASWPHLMELQKKFKNHLQIILVNPYQDKEVVTQAMNKQYALRKVKLDLLSVCYDTVLGEQLFPHNGVPHIVWIGKDGIIKSITFGESINEKNINTYLQTGEINLAQKDIPLQEIRTDRAWFFNNNGKAERLYGFSLLAKANNIPGFDVNYFNDLDGFKIQGAKMSILQLYQKAYASDPGDVWNDILLQCKTELNVKDTTLYTGSKLENPDLLFTYQLYFPPYSLKNKLQLQKRMQSDLDFYFGLEADWVKKVKKCLVLKCKDSSLVIYKSGQKKYLAKGTKLYTRQINKITVDEMILHNLQYLERLRYPVVDETNFTGLLGGMELENLDKESYESWDKALRKYGMSLTLEDREVNVLIISEPDGYQFPFGNEPLPAVQQPQNFKIAQSSQAKGFIEASFDKIEGAEYYRLEYKEEGKAEWKALKMEKNKFSHFIYEGDSTKEFSFRLCGVGKPINRSRINFDDVSQLVYTPVVKLMLDSAE